MTQNRYLIITMIYECFHEQNHVVIRNVQTASVTETYKLLMYQ